ncbi:AraC family transcriptional regulator [Flavobacterium album]|uniref:AraC family transcriptional regulator n=1 Tax=Flavobacterium album TaxID=2175091 RepID=A0A2S1QZR6_9FLAO|nr:AraC family transcriptional regulator [Flavobacterium album]AWH85876.1 AraC family transcriptional regulator [Flavobacterium album]
MKQLQKGQFFGETNTTISLDGITLTDTVYTHDKVDWHYHENAYFTFILQGNVIEGNKKEIYHCGPGALLFHNWDESHYNIKPPGFTRGFHVEIERQWLDEAGLGKTSLEGSKAIANIDVKLLMYKIFRAGKMNDGLTAIAVQSLLIETLSTLQKDSHQVLLKKPKWVSMIDDILHSQTGNNVTLEHLSKLLDIHPVHLSRDFPKYFRCNLGEYIRKLKVEKALSLMAMGKLSLTEIAYKCGFSDQSHFTRSFREINGLNPSMHRKLLLKK